jgi:hypothetical protein
MIWEYPTPLPGSFSLQRAQPYKNWPERDKGALQTAFDAAWNLGSIEVDDLPANILHPADDHSPYSMSELLLNQLDFDSWFGSSVSDGAKCNHVGKRVLELAIQYLPPPLLRDYCNDQAAGKSHTDGAVALEMSPFYTVAELEWQHHLWSRMDAKIASMGGCDHIDLSILGPHRLR